MWLQVGVHGIVCLVAIISAIPLCGNVGRVWKCVVGGGNGMAVVLCLLFCFAAIERGIEHWMLAG